MRKRKIPIIKGFLEKYLGEFEEDKYEIRLSYLEVKNAVLKKETGIRLIFDTMIFRNLQMKEGKFERSEFVDCIFYNCDITNSYFESSTFIRCEFYDSKLDGAHFIDCYLEDVLFSNVLAKFLDLSECKIKIFEINNSTIDESSWFTNKISNLSLESSNLQKSDFYQSKLNKVDLSTCNIEGMKIDLEGIKGSTISKDQAILLCNLIGVNVKET